MHQQYPIGCIGLGVMGENLILNMADHGYKVAVYNRTVHKVSEFIERHPAYHDRLGAALSLAEFTALLAPPRAILLMVKAGAPVDAVISELLPHLTPGDIIIDGGNSHFQDTRRRSRELASQGLHYVGLGISGGEEGARTGPSLMPGGSAPAYEHLQPLLTAIAAQVNGQPCCHYIGADGAGHYVKMVHNGIEYGDMQLISEAYDILQQLLVLDATALQRIFASWNEGELNSYLIEVTAQVLGMPDELTGRPLVDVILDVAGQKGTGSWTSMSALELGVPVPTISSAVFARSLSTLHAERQQAAALYPPMSSPGTPADQALITAVHDALYAAKICSYAQGFALLRAAAAVYDWDLKPASIALLWRGGCIIRAKFLDRISDAFHEQPDLPNLLLHPYFQNILQQSEPAWRQIVSTAKQHGLPIPAFSSALDYFDSYRAARLPANLIQAQRDCFGAHTYQRLDRPGTFHTTWKK